MRNLSTPHAAKWWTSSVRSESSERGMLSTARTGAAGEDREYARTRALVAESRSHASLPKHAATWAGRAAALK